MALLNSEQRTILESLTQRERIEVVLNLLIERIERDLRKKAVDVALAILHDSRTKDEAVDALTKEWEKLAQRNK